MASRLQDVILRGDSGDKPLATDVAAGTLYYSTDLTITERSDGTTWEDYSDGGMSNPGGASTVYILEGEPGEDGLTIVGPPGPAGSPGGGGGGAWELADSQVAAGATQYDFTDLGDYTDIRIALIGVTSSGGGVPQARVSSDNGSSFLSSSGDYIGAAGNGGGTNNTALSFFNSGIGGAAQYGEILIQGFDLANPKVCRGNFFTADSINMQIIPASTAFDAVRVFVSAGTLSGGTIYIFGR